MIKAVFRKKQISSVFFISLAYGKQEFIKLFGIFVYIMTRIITR